MTTTRLADLCRQRQLDVRQLAEQTQLDPSRVLAIVEGRWTPTPQERKKIAAAVGCEPQEISWGHVTPIQHIYGHGPG